MKLRRFLYIFIPPSIVILIWFCSETKIIRFPDFQLKAGYYEPKELEKIIDNLPEIIAKKRENAVPAEFPVSKNGLDDISEVLNQTMLDKLGHFANLPLHRACLINRNNISSEGTRIDPGQSNSGAIGIIPTINHSLEFYATVAKEEDCKNVFKKDFENEKFLPPEYAYPIFQEIGPEDMEKVFKGEPYKIYLREISIDASASHFILRLNYYIVFIAYIIMVLAWSLIYFQIRKITCYIKAKADSL